MDLQAIWSLGLALLDAYALVKKKDICFPVLVSLFVVGDWVVASSQQHCLYRFRGHFPLSSSPDNGLLVF
ncbi:hypothetical protein Ancab_013144 [Ancistrocladus abbreviatus]